MENYIEEEKNINRYKRSIQGKMEELNKRILVNGLGNFLTDKEFKYNPAICREEEVMNLICSILSPNTSTILVGETGVGKTAIVNGLAYKIQTSNIATPLKEKKILAVHTANILSKCHYMGELEKNMQDIINIAISDNTILFIDEIHTIIGAGAVGRTSLDIANILKPYLSDGRITLIGATTPQEFNYINLDPAFSRRFEKIYIEETNEEQTKEIIKYIYPELVANYNINLNISNNELDEIITFLAHITKSSPDKNPALAISILNKSIGIARAKDEDEITLNTIVDAITTSSSIDKKEKDKVKTFRYKYCP